MRWTRRMKINVFLRYCNIFRVRTIIILVRLLLINNMNKLISQNVYSHVCHEYLKIRIISQCLKQNYFWVFKVGGSHSEFVCMHKRQTLPCLISSIPLFVLLHAHANNLFTKIIPIKSKLRTKLEILENTHNLR